MSQHISLNIPFLPFKCTTMHTILHNHKPTVIRLQPLLHQFFTNSNDSKYHRYFGMWRCEKYSQTRFNDLNDPSYDHFYMHRLPTTTQMTITQPILRKTSITTNFYIYHTITLQKTHLVSTDSINSLCNKEQQISQLNSNHSSHLHPQHNPTLTFLSSIPFHI